MYKSMHQYKMYPGFKSGPKDADPDMHICWLLMWSMASFVFFSGRKYVRNCDALAYVASLYFNLLHLKQASFEYRIKVVVWPQQISRDLSILREIVHFWCSRKPGPCPSITDLPIGLKPRHWTKVTPFQWVTPSVEKLLLLWHNYATLIGGRLTWIWLIGLGI